MKSIVGVGVLAVPYATSLVGWIPSILGMAMVAGMNVWGIFCAVLARRILDARDSQADEDERETLLSFDKEKLRPAGLGPRDPDAETSGNAGLGFFDNLVFRVFGLPAQRLCFFCLILGQFTSGVAYVDLMMESSVALLYGREQDATSSVRGWLLVCIFVLLSALSFVQDFKGVAVLSTCAIAIYAFVFAGILRESAMASSAGTFGQQVMSVRVGDAKYGAWFGVVSFAFGGFSIATISYDEMRHPETFHQVTLWAFLGAWLIHALFAVFGYFCFGADVEEVVYDSFSPGSVFRDGSALAIFTIIALSYVLNMLPLYNCMELYLDRRSLRDAMPARVVLVASTVFVAYMVPSLVTVMGVLGTFSGVLTGFVLPAMVYLKVQPAPKLWEQVLCGLTVAFGCVGGACAMFF